jgi:dUTPase
MGFKKHVFPHFGIIDNPYRGDMGIKLYNFSNTDVIIKAGDKIAQLIVYPLIQANVEFTEVVSESKRGEKGFGSSDAIDQDMFKQLECFSEVLVDNKPARLE